MIIPNIPAPEAHNCKFHPDRPAETRCKTCGAYLCYDCRYFYYGEHYCEECFVSLRKDEAKGDWVYPAAAKAVIAISVVLGLITIFGVAGIPRLQTATAEAAVLSVIGIVLWHLPDVILFICGIGAFTFKGWARKGMIYGGVGGILRGAAWPVMTLVTGAAPGVLLIVFYAFIVLYGLSVVLFYSSRRLYDEFRAIRP